MHLAFRVTLATSVEQAAYYRAGVQMRDTMHALYQARDKFLSDGEVRGEYARIVRPEVLASWSRSRLSGASADARIMPFEEGNPESSLCAAAEPVLAQLAERLSGLHAGVLLSDRNARILRRWAPQSSILPQMDKVGSDAGSSGSESFLGTNGIGTVAEDRRAHMVVGPEHYASIFTSFACVGAPIRHPLTRKFAGVVTLNSDVDAASPLLIPLMTSTAQEVEKRLLEQASQRERMLLDKFLVNTRMGVACAVVGEDVFMASPRAARLLEGVDHTVLWQQVSDAVSIRRFSVGVGDMARVVAVRCSPLRLDGRLAGALLTVEADPDRPDTGAALAPRVSPVPPPTVPLARTTQLVAARTRGEPDVTAWTLGSELLPGASAAWAQVVQSAALHVTSQIPLVVFGESGTGKLSLVRSMFARFDSSPHRMQVIDCAGAMEDCARWLQSVRRAMAAGAADVVVLRHLDTLGEDVGGALSALLTDMGDSARTARCVATANPPEMWPDTSTHRRLLDQIAVGRIELPPLRDRREDIRGVIAAVLCRQTPAAHLKFSPAAMLALTRAHWPGNVHQLETVLRGLVSSAAGREVTAEMLPHEFDGYASRRELSIMEQLELNAIKTAITRAQGNKVTAAKRLGISRSTLYRKMRTYALDPDRQFF